MVRRICLTNADRAFFHLVNESASANPFSPARMELDRQIAGCGKEVSGDALFDLVIVKVLKRLKQLGRQGKADLRLYTTEDAQLVRWGLLFEIYYRFTEDFDHLIYQQLAAGDAPCQVPFAKEVLRLISQRGFNDEEAVRCFAFFYQLRRAFYFIHHNLVGLSPSMEKLRSDLWNNVFTADLRDYEKTLWNRMEDFSTLLLGEKGAGKGVAASAIGRSGFIPFDSQRGSFSESFARNFIGINLSQYPESLIESELFGHKKGAFTGAISDQKGVFALCTAHGSIFLDEIGDASIPVQIKLLQVLQERTFSPLGCQDKCRFNGRVIAATNKSLGDLLQKGVFREDFYYRLCSYQINVPPLRQRIEEEPRELEALLGLLVKRTLGESSPEWVGTIQGILAKDLGPNYSWPGNVRELEQAVRRIMLSRHYHGNIYKFPSSVDLKGTLHRAVEEGHLDARSLLFAYCSLLYQKHQNLEEVARRTKLDRRTVKKYLKGHINSKPEPTNYERV